MNGISFDKHNWHWRLADGRVWSTKKAGFADASEAEAWAEANGMTSIPLSPVDAFGEHSEQGLREALAFYGLPIGDLATLDEAKTAKKSTIDANTNRLIERDGLLYQGKHFAMTQGAKINWNSLAAMKDALPYPTAILTIDDQMFPIADQAELMRFLGAAMLFETTDQNSPVVSGRVLRMRVKAAATVEEVNAITDDRR